MTDIHLAPVQGHTDAAYRHFYHSLYKIPAHNYTPFIRVEHGEVRERDIRDFSSPLNEGIDLAAQVIFRDAEELEILLSTLDGVKARKIDLNVGCPFPLQTARGRGAAMVANEVMLCSTGDIIKRYPHIEFSMKMRLGYRETDEWRKTIDIINSFPLTHVTLHPRVARQQYNGVPDLEAYESFLSHCTHKVVYNGDLRSVDDCRRILELYPSTAGLMTGRGALGRPSLPIEILSGEEWSRERRMELMLQFHRQLLNHYQQHLCGDHQVLSKIKPFWEYSEEEIGRKPWKAIQKATNMAKYHTAVASIETGA